MDGKTISAELIHREFKREPNVDWTKQKARWTPRVSVLLMLPNT